jgi:hypothetical protein
MSKQTQKEAVFTAITNVLTEANISFEEGHDVAALMSKDFRAQVNAILFEGFRSGTIDLDRTFTDTELKAYVSGLQSNWIRKDKRLNGDVKYIAKNPGSRAGSGDAQLKAMRALLSTLSSPEDKAEVQSANDSRVMEVKATKVKNVTIDYSVLPAHIAAKFAK